MSNYTAYSGSVSITGGIVVSGSYATSSFSGIVSISGYDYYSIGNNKFGEYLTNNLSYNAKMLLIHAGFNTEEKLKLMTKSQLNEL